MDVKQRQVKGLARSLSIGEDAASRLVDAGVRTMRDAYAADEATLAKHGVSAKVANKRRGGKIVAVEG
jgi:hypothetical protein